MSRYLPAATLQQATSAGSAPSCRSKDFRPLRVDIHSFEWYDAPMRRPDDLPSSERQVLRLGGGVDRDPFGLPSAVHGVVGNQHLSFPEFDQEGTSARLRRSGEIGFDNKSGQLVHVASLGAAPLSYTTCQGTFRRGRRRRIMELTLEAEREQRIAWPRS